VEISEIKYSAAEDFMQRNAFKCSILFLVILLPLPVLAQRIQLLENTSFESWTKHGALGPPDNWDFVTTQFTCMQDTLTVHSGRYSTKLNWSTSTTQEMGYRLLPVYGDSVYTCTLWVYDNDPTSRVRMLFSYDNGSTYQNIYSVDYPGWIRYIYQSTAPHGAKTLELQVRMYDVTAGLHTVYIDDIFLWGPNGPFPDTVSIANIQYTATPGFLPECYPNNLYGQYVAITGTVVGRYERSTMRNTFFLQDADSLWSGIHIHASFDTVRIGDNVTISGMPTEFEGETEFATIFAQVNNSSGNPLPSSKVITCADLSTDSCQVTAEPYEGMYIQINNVTITSGAPNSDFWANDGSGDSCIVTNDVYYQGPSQPYIAIGGAYSFIRGIGRYIHGGYALAPRIAADVARPNLRFTQLSHMLGNNPIQGSRWGRVALKYMGSPQILYFNLSTNDGWKIQNVPLPSLDGAGVEQTINSSFPITDTTATLTTIIYGFKLSDTILTAMPLQTYQDSVHADTIIFCRGYGDSTFLSGEPTPLIGGQVVDSISISHSPFPNQDCGKYEGVPAAVSNSAIYLNRERSLGIDENLLTITEMKNAVGFIPNVGSPNWVANKRQYMRQQKLPIEAMPVSGLLWIAHLLRDKNDVEIDVIDTINGRTKTHTLAVLGIKEQTNGNYDLYIAHDTKQGMGSGGAIIEMITYDQITGQFNGGGGIISGCRLKQVVVEGPIKRSLDDVVNPIKHRNIDGFNVGSGDPTNTNWQSLYPTFNAIRKVQSWSDNGDGKLSAGDTLTLADSITHDAFSSPVIEVSPSVTAVTLLGDTVYFDYFGIDPDVDPIVYVHGSYWQEIYPDNGIFYFCREWYDDGDGVLDTSDYFTLDAISGPDSGSGEIYHIINVAAGITTALGCTYLLGDINGDDLRGGGDVTYGVRFFKLIGSRPPDSCYMDSTGGYLYVAGDVNGNCEFRASDITRLVAYFKLIAPLQYCHFFPPPPAPMRENRQSPLILPKD
jgi:hypothetical protein